MNNMSAAELCIRYPRAGDLIALANENRENNPKLARLCDAVCGLIADLKDVLPEPPPMPVVVATANALGSGDLQKVLDLVQQQSDVIAQLQARIEIQSASSAAIEEIHAPTQ